MDYNDYHVVEDMGEVTHIFKKIFDGGKAFGTDTIKMGFYQEFPMISEVIGNKIVFSMPFGGSISSLREFLENTHYNRTNSIMVDCKNSDTMLTATFYSKEMKIFKDL